MGCARFAEILQNSVMCQVFGRMCPTVFLAFTLKLPIQALLSVAPARSFFWRTTQFQQNEHAGGFRCLSYVTSPIVTKKFPLLVVNIND